MTKSSNNFTVKSFLKATIPNYIIPFIMSFTPGYFRNDTKLMEASYSSIALPSLLAALTTYFTLWYMERTGTFPTHKTIRTIAVSISMVLLFTMLTFLFGLQKYISDICLSAFLGSAITTFTQPVSSLNKTKIKP